MPNRECRDRCRLAAVLVVALLLGLVAVGVAADGATTWTFDKDLSGWYIGYRGEYATGYLYSAHACWSPKYGGSARMWSPEGGQGGSVLLLTFLKGALKTGGELTVAIQRLECGRSFELNVGIGVPGQYPWEEFGLSNGPHEKAITAPSVKSFRVNHDYPAGTPIYVEAVFFGQSGELYIREVNADSCDADEVHVRIPPARGHAQPREPEPSVPPPPLTQVDQSSTWRSRGYAAAVTVLQENGLPIEYSDPVTGMIKTGWGPDIALNELSRTLLSAEWKFTVMVAGKSDDVLVSITGVVKSKSLTGPGYDETPISNAQLSGTSSEYDKMMSIKYDIVNKARE